MIISVKLKNWKSHKNTELTFGKGSNLLLGIMGSGKTSVLDGICYGLFGSLPHKQSKLQDLVRFGEESAEVVVEFTKGKHTFRVERTIRKSGGEASSYAKLYKNGKIVESLKRKVDRYVSSELSMDAKTFVTTIYSTQNDIDYFIDLQPSERKRKFDDIVGLGRIKEAIESCKRVRNKTRARAQEADERYSQEEMNALEREIEEMKSEIEKEKTEAEKARERLIESEKALESERAKYRKLEAEKKKLEEKIEALKKAEGSLERMKKEVEGKNRVEAEEEMKRAAMDLKKEKSNLLEIEKRVREASRRGSEIREKIGKANQRIAMEKEIALEIKTAEKEINALREKTKRSPNEIEMELRKVLEGIASERSAAKEMERLGEGLSHETKSCPVCGRELDEEHIRKIEEEKNRRMGEIRKRIKHLDERKGVLERELREARENERKIRSIESRMSSLKSRTTNIDELEKEMELLKKNLKDIEKKMEELENERKKITERIEKKAKYVESKERMVKVFSAIERARGIINKIKSEIEHIEYDEKEAEETRKRMEEAISEVSKRKEYLKTRKEVAEQKEMVMKEKLERLRIFKEAELEATNLKKMEEELSIYLNALEELQASLRSELVSSINETMERVWRLIYPYGLDTSARINPEGEDYLIEIYDGKEWREVNRFASGGEKVCASLSLRVALSLVLSPEASILILDEPTHNLDQNAVEMLSNLLQNELPELVEQIFFITHDERIMGSRFTSIYKFERDKERRGPTICVNVKQERNEWLQKDQSRKNI